MNLQIVTSEYTGVTEYTGGIGTQYANLAPALVAHGHDVDVVTRTMEAEEVLERDGVRIVRVHTPRQPARAATLWPVAVGRALKRLPAPDVIVAAEYSAGGAVPALGRRRAPLVTHLHSSLVQIIESSQWPLQRRALPQTLIQRVLERVQARRSDGLLSPSTELLEWSRRLWPIAEIPSRVVPNTVDVQRVRALGRNSPPPELEGSGPLIVFTGRLELRKGVNVLVEAMGKIWEAHPSARLALAGGADGEIDGRPIGDHLQELAGEHRSRLLMLGHLPAESLFPCLAAADVVALPSLWESFSLAALEAMAVGRPIAATSGVFPGFMRHGHNALLAPPGDAHALADAMLELLAEPDLRRRLEQGARATAEEHDVGPSAQRFVEALDSLSEGTT